MNLELLFTVPGYGIEEAKLHKLFDDKRIRGEWFSLTSDDLDWVRSNFSG